MADLINKKITVAEYKLSLDQNEWAVLHALLSVASINSTNDALKNISSNLTVYFENDVTMKLYEFFRDNT